jgi:chromosome segregation protein
LQTATEAFLSIHEDANEKFGKEQELKDLNYRLEQFDKHSVEAKLSKQVEFNEHVSFCESIDVVAQEWLSSLDNAAGKTEERLAEIVIPESIYSGEFFKRYAERLQALRKTLEDAKSLVKVVEAARGGLSELRDELGV